MSSTKGRPELDLTGQTVGILTVLERFGKNRHGLVEWQCRCACGEIVIQTTSEIRRGQRDQRDSSCANCAKRRARERSLRASETRSAERSSPRLDRKLCSTCGNLPHRRETAGCLGCGKPFEEEAPAKLEEPSPGCGLGRCDSL